jgi:hypothetical protein
MVINMDESKLRTIAQLQEFLKATPEVSFIGINEAAGNERYEHLLAELRQGRFAARCGCLGLARHENSFDGMLCLTHKISDRLPAWGSQRSESASVQPISRSKRSW